MISAKPDLMNSLGSRFYPLQASWNLQLGVSKNGTHYRRGINWLFKKYMLNVFHCNPYLIVFKQITNFGLGIVKFSLQIKFMSKYTINFIESSCKSFSNPVLFLLLHAEAWDMNWSYIPCLAPDPKTLYCLNV